VTETDENGKYGFDVPAGPKYLVRLTLSDDYLQEGYVFNDNQANDGVITIPVNNTQTGRNYLTLDAGLVCGCNEAASDNADAVQSWMAVLMLLGSLLLAATGMRRETVLR
jgi:hypothetical protein